MRHEARIEKIEAIVSPRKRLGVFVVRSEKEMEEIKAQHPGRKLRFIIDNIPRQAQ
jgi:hypothetical protein